MKAVTSTPGAPEMYVMPVSNNAAQRHTPGRDTHAADEANVDNWRSTVHADSAITRWAVQQLQ